MLVRALALEPMQVTDNVEAWTITNTHLGVPYFKYSRTRPGFGFGCRVPGFRYLGSSLS